MGSLSVNQIKYGITFITSLSFKINEMPETNSHIMFKKLFSLHVEEITVYTYTVLHKNRLHAKNVTFLAF